MEIFHSLTLRNFLENTIKTSWQILFQTYPAKGKHKSSKKDLKNNFLYLNRTCKLLKIFFLDNYLSIN